jgi:hypothetical protein
MCAHQDSAVFRIIQCRKCGESFCLCNSCYRGQAYCRQECREQARRKQKSQANRRYRKTEHGRLDYCDRQRRYRREAASRVADQRSQVVAECARITAPEAVSGMRRPMGVAGEGAGMLVCCKCGRMGRWVEPFERIGVRRR